MTRPPAYPFLLIIFFGIFMAYPLGHILWRAFDLNGEVSLHFFKIMFTTEHFRNVLSNSLNMALATTSITTLFAYPLALIMGRYYLAWASLFHALLLAPLVVPPFVGVLGVRQLFCRFGSINVFLLDNNIIDRPIEWLGSGNLFGIIALQVLHLVPVMYLSIRASLVNTHISLEEAAIMSGASRWRILRSITIPLSIPGWFAGATLVFIASFTDLGTPLIFEYREVISVQIYNMLSDLHENPVGYSFVVFTCFISLTLFLLSKISLLSGSFAGSGRSLEGRYEKRLAAPYHFLLSLTVLCYAVLACIPQIAVLLVALSKEWFMSVLPQQWTLSHFYEVLSHPLTLRSLVISITLSIAASFLTLCVGFFTAYIVCRGRTRVRHLFEIISVLPLAIPGIVFAFGFIGAFSGTIIDNRINPFPLLIAAYAVRRLPAMVRSISAGLQEANKTLEEAALMVGATPLMVSRHIVFPLIKRHILVGVVLTFAYSMIEVSDSLLLALESKFYPVAKAIYSLMGRADGVEVASALGVVVMAIMFIAFYFSERLSRGINLARRTKLIILAAVSISSSAHADSDEIIGISPHWESIRYEFTNAFASHWKSTTGRDLKIRWLDIGGTSDIIKYVRGQFKLNPNGIGIDFVFGGGSDSYLELERYGLLAPAKISENILNAIPPEIGGMPLYSPKHTWFANALSAFGILYNKPAVDRLGLPEPKAWRDLGDAAYFGYVGASDPRKSGSMHAMYEIILQGYGWERGWSLLRRIGRNVRNFMGSASQVGKEIATGEVIYGISIDTYASETIGQLGPDRIKFITPSDFAAVNGDAVAMLKGSPNSTATSAFIEFILSEKGQRLWYSKKGSPGGPVKTDLGKLSVLPALYGHAEPAGVFTDNPFELPNLLSYDAVKAANRWNLVNDIFGAFIIDVHDRLKKHQGVTEIANIPISEQDSIVLSQDGNWGKDSNTRTSQIKIWGLDAREQLPVKQTPTERLRWGPSIIFFSALLYLIIRRAIRH